jgi:RHS repeat-associated protein
VGYVVRYSLILAAFVCFIKIQVAFAFAPTQIETTYPAIVSDNKVQPKFNFFTPDPGAVYYTYYYLTDYHGGFNTSLYLRYTSREDACVLGGATFNPRLNWELHYFYDGDWFGGVDEGWYCIETETYRTMFIPEYYEQCPTGYSTQSDGLCHRPVYSCKAGDTLSGQTCTHTELSCPSSYWLINGQCLDPKKADKNKGDPKSKCNGAGNPIHIGTGNKFQREADFLGGGALPLEFVRFYNSIGGGDAALAAKGWSHTYNRSVSLDGANIAVVSRPDGQRLYFTLNNGLWTGDADVVDTLVQTADGGWRYTDADHTVETYDASGRLQAITNRAGLAQTLSYDAAGRLVTVADPAGRALGFAYDGANRISQLTTPDGAAYAYEYDSTSHLIAVSGPDGLARGYAYNEHTYTSGTDLPGALTGLYDENGSRYATWNYDTVGRAVSSEHAYGGIDRYTLSFTADSDDNPVSTLVIDPLGTMRTYNQQTVQGTVRNAGVSQPGGSGCTAATSAVAYDGNGNPASRTDFNGVTTTYGYDLTRNLETSRTEAEGTPQERTIATEWHPVFRLPTKITEPGRVTTMSYDDATGNLLARTVTDAATGQSRTWTYTYMAPADNTLSGLLKTVDGPRTDVADVTAYAYYANGDLKSITNALGQTTRFTRYDGNGRLLASVDPNGLATTLAYDGRGRLVSRTVGVETTRFGYDGTGNLLQVTRPDNSFITYTYDTAHRLTDIRDSLNNRIYYTLDNMGNRVQESVYDAADTLVQTHSRTFDALDRLWQDVDAYNNTTVYAYDANGNLSGVTDPLGHTRTQTYDPLNRLTQTVDALNGVTEHGYDALDWLTAITDPRGLSTRYTVDALGDSAQQVSPDTGTTTRTYDSAGNLATSTDARGIVSTYSYDALNRVTAVTFDRGTGITFQYDTDANAVGRLVKLTDEAGVTSWTYNSQGRVASKIQTAGGTSLTLNYGYDGAGRLSQITYPSGLVVAYGFDANGRISDIRLNGTPQLSAITYRPFGPAVNWFWGNGAAYARTFDLDGRIAGYPLGSNTRSLSYDAASRLIGFADTASAATQVFGYDALDRLTNWTSPAAGQSYTYDPDGNRLNLIVGATPYAYTYAGTSNQLLGVAGPVAQTNTYDAAGHLTSNGSATFTYNARGRLVGATVGRATTTYVVNGLGQRVAKDGAGGTVRFVYDEAGHLIGEYGKSGGAVEETVYLGDTPVLVRVKHATYAVYADHLNAPRLIVNGKGAPVWQWDADPFGATPANERPSGKGPTFTYNLRLPGQYFDAETGLHYNGFRDYDPKTGRYLESDPIGLAGGLNTYSYVRNNPLRLIDPYGLWEIENPFPLPNGYVDFSAGLGDALLFDAGSDLRELLDIDGGINESSDAYGYGELTGYASWLAFGGVATLENTIAPNLVTNNVFRWGASGQWRGGSGPHFHLWPAMIHHLPQQFKTWWPHSKSLLKKRFNKCKQYFQ